MPEEFQENLDSKLEKESIPDTVKFSVESKEGAEQLVKEFWSAMSHGQDFSGIDNWSQELTMGDRTSVRKAMRDKTGKYIVIFKGNHQPLSMEALNWLKGKGIL